MHVRPVTLSPPKLEDQDKVILTDDKLKDISTLQSLRGEIQAIAELENQNVKKNAERKNTLMGRPDPRREENAEHAERNPTLAELLKS